MQVQNSIVANPTGGEDRQDGRTANSDGILAVLRRRYSRLILATIAGFSAALVYLALAKPTYTATASLIIEVQTPDDMASTGISSDAVYVETEAARLTSPAVLRRAAEALRLFDDPEFAATDRPSLFARFESQIGRHTSMPEPSLRALAALAEAVRAKRRAGSNVIDLNVMASAPAKAVRIAQTVVDGYLAEQAEARSEKAKRENAYVLNQIDDVRARLRDAQERYDEYVRAHPLSDAEKSEPAGRRLARLERELSTARAVRADSKARYEQIEDLAKSGSDLNLLPESSRAEPVESLHERYVELARREAMLASRLLDRHPDLIAVRSELAEAKKQLDAEWQRIVISARRAYEIALAREQEATSELQKAEDEAAQIKKAQIDAQELDEEVAKSRERLAELQKQMKDTEERRNSSVPTARLMAPPFPPLNPSKPAILPILGFGLLAGLGCGLVLAFVADHFDDRVHSASMFGRKTGLTPIVSIPALKAPALARFWSRGPAREVAKARPFGDFLLAIVDTKGRIDASYRQAILRLLLRIKGRQRPGRPHTVMTVSPHTGVGHTVTTLAVAYAAALAGERVLLVDATSIRADLSMIFAPTLKSETVNLDSKEDLAKITIKDRTSGLAFLPIALADLRALKAPQRRHLMAAFNSLCQDYDLVFIDAGAVLDDEAAMSLLPAADQIFIVGRAGITRGDDLVRTAELLEPARQRISGGILTMCRGGA